ncbi:leucine-rich repeat-containing protein [Achlya hypogyna]|uniref:Leucine-rich repeat-containing protein n=1 Tax=Achlya hypogyna TaxID=1202772 RepID=A0A1V9Z8V7_ACHHY|nr:leucine-rich repeat-containing protein [Achlya hypogyna]
MPPRKATSPSVVMRPKPPPTPGLPSLAVTSVHVEVDVHLKDKIPDVRATTAPAKSSALPRQPSKPNTRLMHQPSSKKILNARPLTRTETRLAIQAFQNLFAITPTCPDSRPVTPAHDSEDKLDHVQALVAPLPTRGALAPKAWSIKDVQNNYGWGGKQRFMAQVRKANISNEPIGLDSPKVTTKVDVDTDHITDDNMRCAESYIHTCLQQHLVPEPFIIPKREACAIDLSYYGAGNRPIEALSSCLSAIPKLQSLVVRENRLSDAAVAHIIQSSDFSRLVTLNLSTNQVKRQTINALAAFLDANRVLQTLILSDCMLQADFVRDLGPVVARNRSLTSLDLSKNKLDDACAEALGAMCFDNTNIVALDLSWNSLRVKAAAGLARAIGANQTLQTLRLAWNGFGSGAALLALALRQNHTLQTLDLMGNSIGPAGALALVHSWAESTTLEILCIAQNPIGAEGLRGIFRAHSDPLTMTLGRTIQYDDCGFHLEPSSFELVHHGHVLVDLDNPATFWYGFEYLRVLNLHPAACSWRDVQHHAPPSTKTKLIFHRVVKTTGLATESVAHVLAVEGGDGPWRLPLHGTLSFEFQFKPQVPHVTEITPDAVGVFWQAYSELEFDSDRVKLMKLFLHDHYITAAQAQYLLGTMTAAEAHAEIAPLLMQRVADTATLFVPKPAAPVRHQAILKERAGKLLFFDPRLPNGRYTLDLSVPVEHRIASTLLRLSADDRLENKKTANLNTSQTGNWECFRNETLDGMPSTIARTAGLPDAGELVFDFVVTTRLPRGTDAIDSEVLHQLCRDVAYTPPVVDVVEKLPRHGKSHGDGTRKRKSKLSTAVAKTVASLRSNNDDHHLEQRKLAVRQLFAEASFGITAGQLIELANNFRDTPFGSVEIVAMLLNRVIDLDDLLTTLARDWPPTDVKEAIHRIGWLNIWNPLYAEMEYRLDLSVWEDYQVTCMLAQLGDIEPGENWVDERFNDLFGWELPLSWVQGRIPHAGDLYLRYTTGEHNKNRVMAAREDLKKRVLCGKPRKILPRDADTGRHTVFTPTVMPVPRRRQSILRSVF